MERTSRAVVQTGDRQMEIRELPVPTSLPATYGLLRVEANGVCGSDYGQYIGELRKSGWGLYPLIPGHEPLGRIEWLGDDARRIWGLSEGDRVAVEGSTPCRICSVCLNGREKSCPNGLTYGYASLNNEHGLWGGMSQYLVLRPTSILHRLPDALSFERAALGNALSAGFDWTLRLAGTRVGDSVLVLGAGQRGIACALAAAEAGARQVVITGLTRDADKLALAREFGATDTVNVEQHDVLPRLREITNGRPFDRAIDCTPLATQPILDAIEALAHGGMLVLAGTKGMREVGGFISDKVVLKGLHLVGAFSTSYWAHEQAIRVLADPRQRYPFDKLSTHTVPLERAEEGIRMLGGELEQSAIHVTIAPWA